MKTLNSRLFLKAALFFTALLVPTFLLSGPSAAQPQHTDTELGNKVLSKECNANCQFTWGNGPVTCNCTPIDQHEDICHVTKVAITFGGEPFTVATGYEDSKCLKVTILPGHCAFISYKFRCCLNPLFFTYCCYPTGDVSIRCRPATSEECPG
ncbi:MAG: hypothetical protein ACE5H3_09635 [Planctomycetota bacterium]